MKHFYFAAMAVVLSAPAFAQINEGFENVTSVNMLTNNCWSLSGSDLSTTTGISGTHSIVVIPTTSGGAGGSSNTAQIITPYINLTEGTQFNFDVMLSAPLSTQGHRYIKARLLDANGNYSAYLATLSLDKNNVAPYYTVSVPITVTAFEKLVIDISGSGDGNAYLYVDNFSYVNNFTGCTANAPLPLKMLSFSGSLYNNKAQLKWSVAQNEDGNYFEVQKSTDGINFSEAALIFGDNKAGVEYYSFNESTELPATTYYRIKMANNDRSFSYSNIIVLKTAEGQDNSIQLFQNPIQSTLGFSFHASIASDYQVNLYNDYGALVYSTNIHCQAGSNSVSLNIGDRLTHGHYFLEVTNYAERRTIKVTK